ncbi:MAG: hypothetical protein AAFU67_07415 [Bacteroidota bacterium]
MHDPQLEDQLKDRLRQYGSPIDLDAEWQSLQPHLKQPRRRRWLIWWFSLVSVSLIAMTLFFLTRPTVPKEQSSTTPTVAAPPSALVPAKQERSQTISKEEPSDRSDELQPNSSSAIFSGSNFSDSQTGQNGVHPVSTKVGKTSINAAMVSTPQPQMAIGSSQETAIKHARFAEIQPAPLASAVPLLSTKLIPLPNRVRILSVQTTTPLEMNPQVTKRAASLFAQGGLGFTQQRFQARTTEGEAFANQRKQTESPLETYSFSLGLQLPISPKQHLVAAVAFHEWYDRLDLQFSREQDYLLENVLLQIRESQPSGVQEEIYGDTTVVGLQHQRIRHYNRYRSYSLQLGIGQELFNKGPWSLSAQLGIQWDFNVAVEGLSSQAEINTGTLDLAEAEVYKNSFGVGAQLGLNLQYQFTPVLDLRFSPTLQWQPNSLTTADYPIKSTYTRVGAMIGLSYRLR